MKIRPTAITVLSILNIVFGVWGLLGIVVSAVMFEVVPNQLGAAGGNPIVEVMQENQAYRNFFDFGLALGAAMGVVLVIAGIGMLGLRPWARFASIGYALCAIVWGLVSLAFNVLYLMPPLMEKMEEGGPMAMGAVGGAFGAIVGSVTGLIYPIVLLVFMSRPTIVQAFHKEESESGLL